METGGVAEVRHNHVYRVPTRWGNQLNGNGCAIASQLRREQSKGGPHSLGKSVEWKPKGLRDDFCIDRLSPLAGEIS